MRAALPSEPQQASSQEQKRKLEHHFAENLDSLTYPLLADIYISEGQISRAKKVCLIGLDRHPRHPAGLYLAATLAVRDGDLSAAEKFLQQALKADEYHVGAAELLVAVQERLKRKKPILEESYKKLLHANPLSRAAQERLDHLLSEKQLLEDIRRDLAGLPAEDAETTEASVSAARPVPAAEPESPPPAPVIPIDAETSDHSGDTAPLETDAVTAPPPASEEPVPDGTALADLEEISEEEPPVAEIVEEGYEVPTDATEVEVEVRTSDAKAAEETIPERPTPAAEVSKQVAKEEIFEPGVVSAASPHLEQDLIESPEQTLAESDFAPEHTEPAEPDALASPDTVQMDAADEGDAATIPAVEPEPSDDSSLLTEAEQVKAEEAELARPDMAAFQETDTAEPEHLEADIADREMAIAGDPVAAAERPEPTDRSSELIDETEALPAEEAGAVAGEGVSGDMPDDVSPAMAGEEGAPLSPNKEEMFEPGEAAERYTPPLSLSDQTESSEHPHQPEDKALAGDRTQEKEFLEDYAEPTDLVAEQVETSPTMDDPAMAEQEETAVDVDRLSDGTNASGGSFEPATVDELAEMEDGVFSDETVSILSQDDGLPERLPETDTDQGMELTAGPNLKDQPEIAADSLEEQEPATAPHESEGAVYRAEIIGVEEKTFEPQKESEPSERLGNDFDEGTKLEPGRIKQADEFEPGSAPAESEPEIVATAEGTTEALADDTQESNVEESGFAEAELLEVEPGTDTDQAEIEQEEARFEPVTATPEDEPFQESDEGDTGPPTKLDQDEFPGDSESRLGGDEEEFSHAKEETESDEVVIPADVDEMRTGEQEQIEEITNQVDSFEPPAAAADTETLDADQFIDTEDSIPSAKHEEPYRPDMQSLLQDMRDAHLEEESDSTEAGSEPVVTTEPEPGMAGGDQISSDDIRESPDRVKPAEEESFEPGATTPVDTLSPESEEAPSSEALTTEEDDVSFEPGQEEPELRSEARAVGEDGDAPDHAPADDGELPEADTAASTPVQPTTSPAEAEDRQKDQFEPGEQMGEQPAPASEEDSFEESREASTAREKQLWEAEPAIDKSSEEGDDLPESGILEEEQPQAEVPHVGTGEDEYLEQEIVSTQELEDQASASSTFTPGETSADDGTGLAVPDSHATERETASVPATDLSTTDLSSEADLAVLEKMAYDSREMKGESFEPSTETPAPEDALAESADDAELIPEGDELAEPVPEEDLAESAERKWLDPKMATFTLATIYKVQGLYQQALQVLDLLEEKGADPDRIAAERDAILRQIGAPPSE